jgi:hypothetical protein
MGRFVFVLLIATPLVAAPVPKAFQKKERPTLNGVWEVVERTNRGKPLKVMGREFWVLTDNTYTILEGLPDEAMLKDPTMTRATGTMGAPEPKEPAVLDLWEGRNRDLCRIQLDGDTLHMAITLNQKVPAGGLREAESEVTVSRTSRSERSHLKSVANRRRPASPILRASSGSLAS